MKETLTDLKTRRSCRKYLPQQIQKDELNAVLEAGTYAPTGHGTQSPVMVVIQAPQMLAALEKINAQVMEEKKPGHGQQHPFYGAPTAILVFADKEAPTGYPDAALVMGNLLNAAHAVGLGSCWINRAKEMFDKAECQHYRKAWGLGDQYEGMAICILGYEAPGGIASTPKPRKEGYVIHA